MKARELFLTLCVMMLLLFISGCNESVVNRDGNEYVETDLLVTTQYGKETLVNKSATTNAKTVLGFLNEYTEITTGYQGKFVEAINNIGGKNNSSSSWFFYVNGMSALKGANEISLNNGDRVWWDFHPWDGVPMYNAVIGSYPEPFVNGDKPGNNEVFILSKEEYLDMAYSLKSFINNQGNDRVSIKEVTNENIANRQGPIIVMGLWDDVKDLDYIKQLNDKQNRGGLNFWVEDSRFHFLDAGGNIKYSIDDSSGVIVAYSEGMGSNQPLWLVIGSDPEGLNMVADILLERPDLITGKYGVGVIADSEEIIPLPAETEDR